ncbi:MAG: pyruvate kinase [Anaerolineae bacterium]
MSVKQTCSRRAKIVCTIGPASEASDVLARLLDAGMDVARLNLSHGDGAWHSQMVERLRELAAARGQALGILWDLSGPKLRVGRMPESGLPLIVGEEVLLTTHPIVGQGREIPVQYSQLPQYVREGERILLDDGLLELQVLGVDEAGIHARVRVGGLLRTNKGLNLPEASVAIPAITPKDHEDLRLGLSLGVDWVAQSFVRRPEDVRELKALIARQQGGTNPTPIIAKIEKPEAVEHIAALIVEADGVMVARGDLGIETSPEQVPVAQKMIVAQANAAGKPVITATQMLESMIHQPRPTRAEASDVANAVLDGSDAVMLSGETAVGQYPVEAVQVMARIVQYAEQRRPDRRLADPIQGLRHCSIAEAVSHAATETAADLDAHAIITPTASGYTARMVARYRPEAPIVAVTPNPSTQRRLTLCWGVCPLLAGPAESTDRMTEEAVQAAIAHGWVRQGYTVVITGGSAGSPPGTTNMIAVRVVGGGEPTVCRPSGDLATGGQEEG